MDERVRPDRGVIFAATVLQCFAAPFLLVTSIAVMFLFFVPLFLMIEATSSYTALAYWFYYYGGCMVVMLLSYCVSNGMLIMADMMKANHVEVKNRETPKSRLHHLVSNLFSLIVVECIVGGGVGLACVFTLYSASVESPNASEMFFFQIVIILVGIFTTILKRHVLKYLE